MKLTSLNDQNMRPGLTADQCIKCNICNTECPVLAVSDQFLGPKAVGPQFERFRHPRLPLPADSVSLCSGCGTCSRVCPHGVSVAEMNIQAKARLVEQNGAPLRDQLVSRPDLLGRLNRFWPSAANRILQSTFVRKALEVSIGISRHAPLPQFAARPFHSTHSDRGVSAPADLDDGCLAYFYGCSVEAYEPELGDVTIEILERLGYRVVLPPQNCCGLPLQSNGLFPAARKRAHSNCESLLPFVEAGIPLIGTSTSCTFELKHDYSSVLGLRDNGFNKLAGGTWDLFEFLTGPGSTKLADVELMALPIRVLYHAPCQLKSHWMGAPAIEVLRNIPGLEIILSRSECCGAAGTYGLKSELYNIATRVGESLFQQVSEQHVDLVVTDSETCRWWIRHHSAARSMHPAFLLAVSMGIRKKVPD